MAKLVDALALGASPRKRMGVQVPPLAPVYAYPRLPAWQASTGRPVMNQAGQRRLDIKIKYKKREGLRNDE